MTTVQLVDLPTGIVRAEVTVQSGADEARDRQHAVGEARYELSVQRSKRARGVRVTTLRATPGNRLFEVDLIGLEDVDDGWD